MDEESYRHELRNHFMGQMKNSKLQLPFQSSALYNYKDQTLRPQQETIAPRKIQEYDIYQQQQTRNKQAQRNSGGDADRLLYESNYASETYRRSNEPTSNYMRQLHIKAKQQASAALPSTSVTHKYRQEEPSTYDMYETDSNLGGNGANSDDSKSQKSSKTVVSKKSSQELRKIVKSQCKLHEVIDETLKQMCNTTDNEANSEEVLRVKEQPTPSQPSHRNCKNCSDKLQLRGSQKDVMTEIGKGDFLDCRSGDTLTISVDDVVNSKVINPMIRKLQRMYLNNLREEMSLMEDLERLPHKVNEVYKATIFKQKE